jgi:N-acetylneuraminic acid mutarotase
MSRRSLVSPVGALLALFCLGASLSLAATPLSEPQPWVWQQVARFGGTAVRGAQVFTIGDTAYTVSGMPDSCIPHHEVWKYDSVANSWTRTSDYPGTPIIEGVGFSIGGTGYVCLGVVNVTPDRVAEFWQFDPQTNTWTRKADFPGAARSGCVAVTIGRKAYVFGGYSTALLNEIWEYDQETDAWTRKADCPGNGRFLPAGFAIGDRAYFGTGSTADGMSKDIWEYDPQADTWSRKADFPGEARAYAIGLSAGGKGYVVFGLLRYAQPMPLVRDIWEYDPASDAWTQRGEFAGPARSMATGFVLGSDIYFGLGNNSSGRNLGDVWRTRPVAANQ